MLLLFPFLDENFSSLYSLLPAKILSYVLLCSKTSWKIHLYSTSSAFTVLPPTYPLGAGGKGGVGRLCGSLLLIPRVCDHDRVHLSPQKGLSFPPMIMIPVESRDADLLKIFCPVESLSICMQKDILKWLMTFKDRWQWVPAVVIRHHDYAADLSKPGVKTEQQPGVRGPGVDTQSYVTRTARGVDD